MGREAQVKTLRLRMYVLCSECARQIDLTEGNKPQREVERLDLISRGPRRWSYDRWPEATG